VATITVIRNFAELAGYADRWNALLERSHFDDVFLTWEWMSAWSLECVRGDGLLALAVHDGGELVALAPLCVETVPCACVPDVRVLRPIAAGVSDYFDFVGDGERIEEYATLVWEHLFGPLSREWDVLDLVEVPETSPILRTFGGLARTDGRCEEATPTKQTSCSYIELPSSREEYLARCRRSRRHFLRGSRRRLSSSGELRLQFCRTAGELPGQMESLISLNKLSWLDRGGSASFTSPELERFHHRVARSLLVRGNLLLCSMTLDGDHIASFYGFEYRDKVYYYISAVRRLPLRRVNVLDTLLLFCVEEAIDRGCREFDLLRGDEEYKRRWTSSARRNSSVRFYNRTMRSRIVRFCRKVRNANHNRAMDPLPPPC
jgi:CelD/BcsL family acetyltransferase involved in cellulose biosynthesis